MHQEHENQESYSHWISFLDLYNVFPPLGFPEGYSQEEEMRYHLTLNDLKSLAKALDSFMKEKKAVCVVSSVANSSVVHTIILCNFFSDYWSYSEIQTLSWPLHIRKRRWGTITYYDLWRFIQNTSINKKFKWNLFVQ